MKIAMNAINITGYGISMYTSKLIEALLEKYGEKISITLYTTQDVAPRYEHLSCKIVALPFRHRLIKEIYIQLILPFVLKKQKIETLHSVGNFALWTPFTRQILTIHDTYEYSSPERHPLKKRLLMRLSILLTGLNSKHVIAVSQNTNEDIKKYYPILKNKTHTIYSGCNEQVISKDVIKFDKSPYILFVGTLEPGKNLVTLIKAMTTIKKEFDIKLKITGAKGWAQDHLPELVSELGLYDSIEFTGFVSASELTSLYQNATALVMPSTYEGFGFPVIEAMANGCPVVCANNSALPEAGGEAALYFETMDHEDLAGRIVEIINNDDMRNKMIERGLSHAADFSWRKSAEETYQLY